MCFLARRAAQRTVSKERWVEMTGTGRRIPVKLDQSCEFQSGEQRLDQIQSHPQVNMVE